jgi:hypothetical protein
MCFTLSSAVMNALSSQCMTDSTLITNCSNEEKFEIEDSEERLVWHKEEFKKVLDEMSQLYSIHMRINVCSERHSDVKSMS